MFAVEDIGGFVHIARLDDVDVGNQALKDELQALAKQIMVVRNQDGFQLCQIGHDYRRAMVHVWYTP